MKNSGVTNGLYMGVALVLLSLIMYLFDQRFMLTWGSLSSWLVYILFMVKAGRDERDSLEGFASFGEMLKPTFLAYVVGSGVAAIFAYILFNFIDPTLLDTMKDIQIEAMDKMAGFMGEDAAEEAKEALRDQDTDFGLGTVALGYSIGLIFPGIILALIISAVLKKEKPMA